jgi:ribonucleoside-diphosphate reductase alpha chain
MSNGLKFQKRNGSIESVNFEKIHNRIDCLLKENELSSQINTHLICKKTIELMTDNIPTSKLDLLSADICANMITLHSDYSLLGARILISNLIKNLKAKYNISSFTEITNLIDKNIPNYLDPNYVNFINSNNLDNIINNKYDFNIDYFGFKTLERSYLINNKITKETYETVQALWLRVAVCIHMTSNLDINEKINKIKETYECLALGLFIHATPTLFNSDGVDDDKEVEAAQFEGPRGGKYYINKNGNKTYID